jgi:type II secretory ATPase GspE/PulE/Tfp pilus assembly ATPase PilB-like protein
LLEKILDSALSQQASDIHLEPQRDYLQARVRIDGVLQPLLKLPTSVQANLIARVKILANLDITEKRLPQDGQFMPRGNSVKIRVSTLPSVYGEKVVLRILPAEKLRFDLDVLRLAPKNRQEILDLLRSLNGLILVTGPTGSGKTTTLYSMLDTLNTPQRNIVTVEDPVEYQLEGITQVQVNPDIGYTFEKVLRSFLRQDPNVMLVGEIRDLETAEIALKAAVTGHLVLSTLHTNDAPSTVYRLISMGLPPYLVAAACRLIISQRLVRTLCPKCKAPSELTEEESLTFSEDEIAALPQVFRARGCSDCHGIGFAGRQAVCEVMGISSHRICQAIVDKAGPGELRKIACDEGMVPLRRELLQMVADGVTSIEEVLGIIHQ